MSESFLRLARKWTECAAAAALRDIGAVSRKMHRAACMRMNQCFLKPDVNTVRWGRMASTYVEINRSVLVRKLQNIGFNFGAVKKQ